MKSIRALFACFGMLITLVASSVAEAQQPTFRETADWIIISGFRDFGKGALPWTFAIRKDSVKSVTVWTDHGMIPSTDESKRYEAQEEIQKLPAVIHVTTDELGTSGENKQYEICGLTHETAPAMLEKILEALGGLKSAEGAE